MIFGITDGVSGMLHISQDNHFSNPFYSINGLFMRMEKNVKKKPKKDSFDRETVLLATQQTINN